MRDALEMRKIVRGYGKAFAQGNAGDQNIYFADQQAPLSEVGPDVGSQDGGVVGKRNEAMDLAKLLEARELCAGMNSFQSARIFVVAEFRDPQLPILPDVPPCMLSDHRVVLVEKG